MQNAAGSDRDGGQAGPGGGVLSGATLVLLLLLLLSRALYAKCPYYSGLYIKCFLTSSYDLVIFMQRSQLGIPCTGPRGSRPRNGEVAAGGSLCRWLTASKGPWRGRCVGAGGRTPSWAPTSWGSGLGLYSQRQPLHLRYRIPNITCVAASNTGFREKYKYPRGRPYIVEVSPMYGSVYNRNVMNVVRAGEGAEGLPASNKGLRSRTCMY